VVSLSGDLMLFILPRNTIHSSYDSKNADLVATAFSRLQLVQAHLLVQALLLWFSSHLSFLISVRLQLPVLACVRWIIIDSWRLVNTFVAWWCSLFSWAASTASCCRISSVLLRRVNKVQGSRSIVFRSSNSAVNMHPVNAGMWRTIN